MWTNENLKDAMHILLDSDQLEKVTNDETTYVVADQVPYMEELYLLALDELILAGEVKSISLCAERESFRITGSTSKESQ